MCLVISDSNVSGIHVHDTSAVPLLWTGVDGKSPGKECKQVIPWASAVGRWPFLTVPSWMHFGFPFVWVDGRWISRANNNNNDLHM